MSDHLLAILLATTSARGSSLVYQWPPNPVSSPRLKRPPPKAFHSISQLDNPWKASHPTYQRGRDPVHDDSASLDEDYLWEARSFPGQRDRSASASRPRPSSGRNTPAEEPGDSVERNTDYETIFGFSSEFLAGLLCPKPGLCHQKFELIVDEIAYIGHPVCTDEDQVWRSRSESKTKSGFRGRDTRNRQGSRGQHSGVSTPNEERAFFTDASFSGPGGWLQTFHLAFVLDLPDASSAASGNVSKFMNVIYEQLAFTVTAVLFRDQVLSNFVESECDKLISLREDCVAQGVSFSNFAHEALQKTSISLAMKTIYDAVKSSSIAYITLNDLPLEIHLPPYLDILLENHSDYYETIQGGEDHDEAEYITNWGEEMQVGWRLPALAPWKALLLLDNSEWDSVRNLRHSQSTTSDKDTVEGLMRFLDLASVNLSLVDMATLLDWELEPQVYPVVRWLVQHRRAKIVDLVQPGLRTVYILPETFDEPLSVLSATFKDDFSDHPQLPPLPVILSTLSNSTSSSTSESTFFAALVKDKVLIPLWQEVVLWMLKRDLLITLHLRIRLVVTAELRSLVAKRRTKSLRERGRITNVEDTPRMDDGGPWVSMSPRTAHNFSRRLSSKDSGKSQLSELDMGDGDSDHETNEIFDEGDEEESSGIDGLVQESGALIIPEPGKANRMQRRWLAAMSEGKDPWIARLFKQINQYFDGKKTDSEILFRAEITRKQLREVLHHYQEYVLTFLHPS